MLFTVLSRRAAEIVSEKASVSSPPSGVSVAAADVSEELAAIVAEERRPDICSTIARAIAATEAVAPPPPPPRSGEEAAALPAVLPEEVRWGGAGEGASGFG